MCYFFTGNGIKGDDLITIVKNCVETILNLELLPTCIICDQGTQNQRLFKLLGGTEKDPYTIISNTKLFLIYDMPHLVKSLRNNLLNGDFEIGKNKIVSINDIKTTYNIDVKNTARAMVNITPTHLAPNPFQKIN